MKISMIIVQVALMAAVAPLVSGFIRKAKNNLRMRKGAPVLQPYYNLAKLLKKDEVISENTSWIFRITPFIVLSSVLVTLLLIPFLGLQNSIGYMGDILLVIFMLSLGRFFMSLAGLDAGSSFGGMGSSRDMFISSLVEPVMLLSIFVVGYNAGSTGPAVMAGQHSLHLSNIIAALAFFMAMIAETSRIPVDNQETHLELTMVHEAMILEYSGRRLAMIELAAHIKQILFFTILANIVIPFGGAALYPLKIIAIAVVVSVMEVSLAKMRLFRVVDFVTFAFALSIMAMVFSAVGL